MKVLLIQPSQDRFLVTPPLGPAYLAAVLETHGIPVNLVDLFLEDRRPDDLTPILARERPDLVGISCMTTDYPTVLKMCQDVKRHDPSIKTVLGGPHVSALPELPLNETAVDYIVRGEGEHTLLELALATTAGKPVRERDIPGLGYKDHGQPRLNIPRAPIEPLEALPFPEWKFTPLARYPLTRHGGFIKQYPVVPVITSRGCPYQCTYCASHAVWGRRFRARSAVNVVEELEYMKERHGAREVHFEDDNISMNRKRMEQLCTLMIERELEMTWVCPNGIRADTLDRDLLALMHRSGCHSLSFGIESGNQHILDSCKKSTPLAKIEDVINAAKSVGISTTGFFIFGLPGETPQTIKTTIKFLKRLALDRLQIAIFVPFPGCDEFEQWIAKNELDVASLHFSDFTISHALYTTDELPAEALIRFQKRALREFYLRPRIMFKLLKDLRWRQLRYLLKRIREFRLLP